MLARNSLLARVADCASTQRRLELRGDGPAPCRPRPAGAGACGRWPAGSGRTRRRRRATTGRARVAGADALERARRSRPTLATMGFISPRRTITKVAKASTSQPASIATRTRSTKIAACASRWAFSRRAAATVNSTRSRCSANSGCSVWASSSRAVATSLRCSAGSSSRSTTWKYVAAGAYEASTSADLTMPAGSVRPTRRGAPRRSPRARAAATRAGRRARCRRAPARRSARTPPGGSRR